MPADEVHQTKDMLELSGFTHQNIIRLQEGGYKLGKSITGFPQSYYKPFSLEG